MSRWARRLAVLTLGWAAGAALTAVVPLGSEPRNAAERDYHRSAIEMRHYINDKPVPRLLTTLLVYKVALDDLREVPRSCEGGSSSSASLANAVGTVTDYTAWAIPLHRYAVSCGGAMISRGRPTYGSPEPLPERTEDPRLERSPPPPPPPPLPPLPVG